jgi:intergrase/recombinase
MPACATYYYITNENGKVINKYTLKPYKGKQMDMYAFHDKLYAEQFLENINKL